MTPVVLPKPKKIRVRGINIEPKTGTIKLNIVRMGPFGLDIEESIVHRTSGVGQMTYSDIENLINAALKEAETLSGT